MTAGSARPEVAAAAAQLRRLHVADPILRYVRQLGATVRHDPRVRIGVSTRGLKGLVGALQVYAAARGRHYVVPSDVQRLAEPVLAEAKEAVGAVDEVLADEGFDSDEVRRAILDDLDVCRRSRAE